ncbi:hypothetical protein ACFXPX_14340 [Kitasatospora sp. NPDC059146]|uniref:hypothetical protein n=1 Tax=Kitasatospora sp. NPDC059146 TaxID=3346741 RepID=UPI00368D04E6
MRLRNAGVAALGALTLLLAVPSPANAAAGEFIYKTGLLGGKEASLPDPQSSICINLDGTSELEPGFSPRNYTDATATVFADTDCNGDVYYVMNPGKKLGPLVRIRSVIFA